jgi:cytochrome P450
MRAVVYYLAKYPSAYSKLIAEFEEAALLMPASFKDAVKLPYLGVVIQEARRLVPGVSLVMERIIPKIVLILPDGRFIPAGIRVSINPNVTNHDNEVFGPDIFAFNPNRWLQAKRDSDSEHEVRHKKMLKIADFVFGTRSRICIKRRLATVEIYKLMATLYNYLDVNKLIKSAIITRVDQHINKLN